jgi:hypothetical protein
MTSTGLFAMTDTNPAKEPASISHNTFDSEYF